MYLIFKYVWLFDLHDHLFLHILNLNLFWILNEWWINILRWFDNFFFLRWFDLTNITSVTYIIFTSITAISGLIWRNINILIAHITFNRLTLIKTNQILLKFMSIITQFVIFICSFNLIIVFTIQCKLICLRHNLFIIWSVSFWQFSFPKFWSLNSFIASIAFTILFFVVD